MGLFIYGTMIIFAGTWDGIQCERRIGFPSSFLHTVILTIERCRSQRTLLNELTRLEVRVKCYCFFTINNLILVFDCHSWFNIEILVKHIMRKNFRCYTFCKRALISLEVRSHCCCFSSIFVISNLTTFIKPSVLDCWFTIENLQYVIVDFILKIFGYWLLI